MTDRRGDAVDVFLADLGAAAVPGDLASNVTRRVRDERQPRRSPVPAWFAVAAVLVTAALALTAIAWIVAGPGPGPLPTPAPSIAPVVSPSASPSASSASPEAPSSTGSPSITAYFDLHLGGKGSVPDLPLYVADASNTVTGVLEAAWPGHSPEDPHGLVFARGSEDRSVVVGWIGSNCDARAELGIAPNGHTFSVRYPARSSCDAVGIPYAVELHFSRPIDVSTFTGRWSEDLVTVADVAVPLGIAFTDGRHGFTAWQTEPGDAVILETSDAGATWRAAGLGYGTITALSVSGDGTAWAGVRCPQGGMPGCFSGRYRLGVGDGVWARVDTAWPVALSFTGDAGAALAVSPGSPVAGDGAPIPDLLLSDDGGEAWRTLASPCPDTLIRRDIARVGTGGIIVLCESAGSNGMSVKEIRRSADGGLTWAKPAYAPYEGTGARLDLPADGTGWLWTEDSTQLTTLDGGATWTALDVADGHTRLVEAADALGGGAGVAVILDLSLGAHLVLSTEDGRTWTQLGANLVQPCCGG
jgi:hypothetical protein